MRIDIVTIFPELFTPHLETGLLGKAVSKGILEVGITDLRTYGRGKHRSVDDEPYGGGAGMVMRPEPIFEAVEPLRGPDSHVVLLSAKGERLDHPIVEDLARRRHLIMICGRYEGVDERVALHLADRELSIGDYVLQGGEVAALVVIEALSRHVPGVLGNPASLDTESHSDGSLEHPQYTRPADFRGFKVPEVLLSGDHGAVAAWRRRHAGESAPPRPASPPKSPQ